jgi:hypothetical protein
MSKMPFRWIVCLLALWFVLALACNAPLERWGRRGEYGRDAHYLRSNAARGRGDFDAALHRAAANLYSDPGNGVGADADGNGDGLGGNGDAADGWGKHANGNGYGDHRNKWAVTFHL